MVRRMSTITSPVDFACTCPLCGAALAVTFAQPGQGAGWRSYDVAQDTVLEHLFAVHEPVAANATVVTLGALAVRGATSLQVYVATWR
jgi:hypothetical protein